ncbi:hypothetical protein OPV22_031804 [Ensete ventricosum]|uniref:Uncharacterized protein n=1 Tax=Ensete ventricosum TaxID=4639 RepID=A0AAV8PQ02_ENSVE|nr:hypothetical protein OPV22_031804 [Ensete ventricosum]
MGTRVGGASGRMGRDCNMMHVRQLDRTQGIHILFSRVPPVLFDNFGLVELRVVELLVRNRVATTAAFKLGLYCAGEHTQLKWPPETWHRDLRSASRTVSSPHCTSVPFVVFSTHTSVRGSAVWIILQDDQERERLDCDRMSEMGKKRVKEKSTSDICGVESSVQATAPQHGGRKRGRPRKVAADEETEEEELREEEESKEQGRSGGYEGEQNKAEAASPSAAKKEELSAAQSQQRQEDEPERRKRKSRQPRRSS